METLKQQLIEKSIESVKTTARVFDVGYIEAYRMWLKTSIAGPAVRAAVREAVGIHLTESSPTVLAAEAKARLLANGVVTRYK